MDNLVNYNPQNANILGMGATSPFSSICTQKKLSTTHIEVPPNSDKLLYDLAIYSLQKSCNSLPLEEATSIKFHTNSWGLSSNKHFADDIVPKLKNLKDIDMSDTIQMNRRSDLCMGVQAWLLAAAEFDIRSLNLDDNFLGVDGVRSCREFLAVSRSL